MIYPGYRIEITKVDEKGEEQLLMSCSGLTEIMYKNEYRDNGNHETIKVEGSSDNIKK